LAVKHIQWDHHTVDISYEIINPEAKRDMIVLHGWGSHKELMRDAFKAELDTFRHIYIDLPGFGNSTASTKMSTHDYREIIASFLESISAKRDIIIGHSFGGKVATLLNPDLLVLLSSSGILESKSLKVLSKIYLFKLLKVFGFAKLRKFFVASDAKSLEQHMYETFKQVVNEDFSKHFAHFRKKALICWGTKDQATRLSSGREVARLMPQSTFLPLEGDHYFFLHHVPTIVSAIETSYISH